jgi:transcriptional regulator with XRE-family HTH domain/mannose-6-phosphate isomerase-like protein (cupin superfamily)
MSTNDNAAARLRSLRLSQSWTLAELSRRTDLPISTISKMENGKMSLSYDKLVKLSAGLGIGLAQLLAPEPVPNLGSATAPSIGPSLGRRSITRAQEGGGLETPSHFCHYVASDVLNKSMTPVIMEIKARVDEGKVELTRDAGEKFILVLEGEIVFICELYAPVVLKEGDSIYFDAGMGHACVRNTEARSRLLSVCSASPDFSNQVGAAGP